MCSLQGGYVGAEDIEDDDEPFEEKMKRLTARLEEQFRDNTRRLTFGDQNETYVTNK